MDLEKDTNINMNINKSRNKRHVTWADQDSSTNINNNQNVNRNQPLGLQEDANTNMNSNNNENWRYLTDLNQNSNTNINSNGNLNHPVGLKHDANVNLNSNNNKYSRYVSDENSNVNDNSNWNTNKPIGLEKNANMNSNDNQNSRYVSDLNENSNINANTNHNSQVGLEENSNFHMNSNSNQNVRMLYNLNNNVNANMNNNQKNNFKESVDLPQDILLDTNNNMNQNSLHHPDLNQNNYDNVNSNLNTNRYRPLGLEHIMNTNTNNNRNRRFESNLNYSVPSHESMIIDNDSNENMNNSILPSNLQNQSTDSSQDPDFQINSSKNVNNSRDHLSFSSDYDLQSGVEEMMEIGTDLRSKILETLGTLVYDFYDEFSIDQLEALYTVYHDTLKRKYNIFDVVAKLKSNNYDLQASEICKTVLENICSCFKDSSKVCMHIRTPHYSRKYLSSISENGKQVYNLGFPKGLSLSALLRKLQKNELKITPKFVSGLLQHNVHNNFNNEVRTSEKILVEYLNSLDNSVFDQTDLKLGNLHRFKTIDEFLKVFLENYAENCPPIVQKAALLLSTHVQRDTNSISENIENFGITYENKTINLKYLFELVIPNDLVDSDIIKDRDFLQDEMKKNNIPKRYLLLDKYEHASPDQLLLEILRQMKKISKIIHFPPNIVKALRLHAEFWRKDHTIENISDFLVLFTAYENLLDNPKFKFFFELADAVKEKLKSYNNVHLELSCTMPRPCLHRVLGKVLDCNNIDKETKDLVSKFLEQLDQNGRPVLIQDPLNKKKNVFKLTNDQTTESLKVDLSGSSLISDSYSTPDESTSESNIINYTQVPEKNKIDFITPDISSEEGTITTQKTTDYISTTSLHKKPIHVYSTNTPEKNSQEELTTTEISFTHRPITLPTTIKNGKYKHVKNHPELDKSNENISKEVIQLQPSGKSSTILPNPDSTILKDSSEESTTTIEPSATISTKIPNYFLEGTTTNSIIKATESTDTSGETTTIRFSNENQPQESLEMDKVSSLTSDESTTYYSVPGIKTDKPSTQEITTVKSELIENSSVATTPPGNECDDTCVTESCEGTKCIKDNKVKENTTPSECTNMSCEDSSEKPCNGPNCSITTTSADCNDDKCSTENPSENCSGPNCNTPITSVPIESTTLLTSNISKEECTNSDCTTGENCANNLCSTEKNCNSGSCLESIEKCEGPNCSTTTSSSCEGNNEDCNENTSKSPNDDILNTTDPPCNGSDCSLTDSTNLTKPCTGSDCTSSTTLENKEECNGKDCVNSVENTSTVAITDQPGTLSPMDLINEVSNQNNNTKICESKDPHHARKVKRLEKIRKLTALLAEDQEEQASENKIENDQINSTKQSNEQESLEMKPEPTTKRRARIIKVVKRPIVKKVKIIKVRKPKRPWRKNKSNSEHINTEGTLDYPESTDIHPVVHKKVHPSMPNIVKQNQLKSMTKDYIPTDAQTTQLNVNKIKDINNNNIFADSNEKMIKKVMRGKLEDKLKSGSISNSKGMNKISKKQIQKAVAAKLAQLNPMKYHALHSNSADYESVEQPKPDHLNY